MLLILINNNFDNKLIMQLRIINQPQELNNQ